MTSTTETPAKEPAATAVTPAAQTDVAGLTPASGQTDPRRRLGDVVVELGFVDRELVEQVMAKEREGSKPMGALLVDSGIIDSSQLARALAERNTLDYVDLNVFEVDQGAANLVGAEEARRYRAIPIAFLDDGALLVATSGSLERRRLRRHRDGDRLRGPPGDRDAGGRRRPDRQADPAERVGGGGRRRERRERRRRRRAPRPARVRRGGAGRQARPLGDRGCRQPRRLRHPLRPAKRRHAGPLPDRRRRHRLDQGARRSWSPASSPGSRSWPSSTSPSGGCPRTAGSSSPSTGATSTSASRPCR